MGHRQEVELGHATPVEGHREVVPADTADIEAEEELVDASVVYVVVAVVHIAYVAQPAVLELHFGLYAEPLVAAAQQAAELDQ